MSIETLSSVAAVIGVCIAGINIIVEVLKNLFMQESKHYNLLVLCVSVFMAFFVVCLYCSITSVKFTPLVGVGALVGGIFLSYGAMFGYDNLYGNFMKKLECFFKEENE